MGGEREERRRGRKGRIVEETDGRRDCTYRQELREKRLHGKKLGDRRGYGD